MLLGDGCPGGCHIRCAEEGTYSACMPEGERRHVATETLPGMRNSPAPTVPHTQLKGNEMLGGGGGGMCVSGRWLPGGPFMPLGDGCPGGCHIRCAEEGTYSACMPEGERRHVATETLPGMRNSPAPPTCS